ncbi:MAG TPA: hypothetical protein H9910_01435, partial [Candidatus Mediterraneibacter quadrami]|nr:hypothetical protein [Candidatus Mediterraneibacter quadrami]
ILNRKSFKWLPLMNKAVRKNKRFPLKKGIAEEICIFITGYGQNETLSCLINYNLQRSGGVKALPFGCCAALTHPDPADMIQTSRQSLSAAQIPPPPDTFFGYCLSN